jgi:glycosyltransferase involved in cell wall biosynthesis
MKVSVIIPTYNRSEILEYTLSSLTAQDFPNREYEVIVIDDGSSDNTREVVNLFKNEMNIVYYFQEDKGFRVALARNEGIKRAKGDVLVFIDTGIVVGSTFVREHYSAHFGNTSGKSRCIDENYAVIGYVYGFNHENKEGDVTPEYIDFSRPNQMIQNLKVTDCYSDMREFVYRGFGGDFSIIPAPWTLFYTNNISVKKNVMLDAGCFDESFITWGVEDIECGYRLFENNVKFKLSREACAVHYPHERHRNLNYVSGKINEIKFYNKFKKDVLELLSALNSLDFNIKYMEYLRHRDNLGDQPLFSEMLTSRAAMTLSEEIPSGRNIIFGCQEGFLLDVCKSEAATESDAELMLKAGKAYPDVTVHRCLGIRTLYRAKSFETSLIAGAGIVLEENFISSLAREALRISKKVYWLRIEGGTDLTDYNYTKIKNLGNGIALYQIETTPINI